MMQNNCETHIHLVHFIVYVKNQFATLVNYEFNIKNHFESKGILHQIVCVEIIEQNDIVERMHRHLLNVTRALIFQYNIPTQLWTYVVNYVAFF